MLQAGLGNQLFIYGASLSMARRLDTDLVLDTSLFRFDTRRNYELGFFNSGASAVISNYQDRKNKRQDTSNLPAKFAQYLTIRKLAKNPKVLMEHSKTFDARTKSWGDGTKLLGYFQSWRYLDSVQTEIRERVLAAQNLPQSSRDWLAAQQSRIAEANNAVLVHVRRGDYLLPAHRDFHGVLQSDYYQRALESLGYPSASNKVYVMSDDQGLAREGLSFVSDFEFINQPPDSTDALTLLLAATFKKFVIANSSFSWWAAWLSGSTEVVAPKDWFARPDLDSRDVCPKDWVLI
jgi:hypothetical protein